MGLQFFSNERDCRRGGGGGGGGGGCSFSAMSETVDGEGWWRGCMQPVFKTGND